MQKTTITRQWQLLWDYLQGMSTMRALSIAIGIWAVYAVVIMTIVAIQPDRRTVTTEYQKASMRWWGGKTSLYQKRNGYLYFPQFAILYTPYELLPDRIGEPLWRLTCLSLLAGALWMAARRISDKRKAVLFLIATALVLPSSFSSARNGQVNMPLAALFLIIALTLARERWWISSVLLFFTLILKPIAAAPLLVCGVLYPRLRVPLFVGLIGFVLLPYLHFNSEYVTGEYGAFIHNLLQAGNPTGKSWCDFAGMLGTFGIDIPYAWQWAVRIFAGLATLWIAWKIRDPRNLFGSAFMIMFLSVIYLMLFNPRTETNSYVILSAFVAIQGAYMGLIKRQSSAAVGLLLLAVILGSENYGWPIFPLTNLWLKALATCCLGLWLIRGQDKMIEPSPAGKTKICLI